jgi:hypothetical protein
MKAITIAMILYVVVCAALVFAVSMYEDAKRRHGLHRGPTDDSARPTGDSSLSLETRDIEPPHKAPRTRHAA